MIAARRDPVSFRSDFGAASFFSAQIRACVQTKFSLSEGFSQVDFGIAPLSARNNKGMRSMNSASEEHEGHEDRT